VAAQFAERDVRFKSTMFAVYSMAEDMFDHFLKVADGFTFGMSDHMHPASVMFADFMERKSRVWPVTLCWGKGVPQFLINPYELRVPDGRYLIVASPVVHVAGKTPDEMTPKRTISAIVGFLACIMGRAIIFDLITESIADVNGKESEHSPFMRVPQGWGTLSFTKPEVIKEIADGLATTGQETRERILYGMSMIGRALREDNERFRFIEYWVALEGLAKGLQKEITRELAGAYGSNDKFVLDDLELRVVIRLRNDLMHHGKQGNFSARFERLLQCYALDLVRHRLGLACARFAEGAKQAREAT
jgi:hypothetical protein